jgi:sugar lactone lactonase YvrE
MAGRRLSLPHLAPRRLWLGAGAAAVAAVTATGALGGSSRGTITTIHTRLLSLPTAVAIDRKGHLYIADTAGGLVLEVARGRTTMVGRIGNPTWLAVDGKGNVYVDNDSNKVFKVTPARKWITFAGTDENPGTSTDGRPATSTQLNGATGLAVDRKGNVYIAESLVGKVDKVSPDGILTTFAGGGPGLGDGIPATQAKLFYPLGLAVDGKGNVYIVESADSVMRVRKVSPAGTITTIAGSGRPGFSGDAGPATKARLRSPRSVTVDGQGNLYIADAYNNRVRIVSPRGRITTFAGSGKPLPPLSPGSVPAPQPGSIGDGGPATSARLLLPTGVAVDGQGNVYIADSGHRLVREVRRR